MEKMVLKWLKCIVIAVVGLVKVEYQLIVLLGGLVMNNFS